MTEKRDHKINYAGLTIDLVDSIQNNLRGELKEDATNLIELITPDIKFFINTIKEKVDKEYT